MPPGVAAGGGGGALPHPYARREAESPAFGRDARRPRRRREHIGSFTRPRLASPRRAARAAALLGHVVAVLLAVLGLRARRVAFDGATPQRSEDQVAARRVAKEADALDVLDVSALAVRVAVPRHAVLPAAATCSSTRRASAARWGGRAVRTSRRTPSAFTPRTRTR